MKTKKRTSMKPMKLYKPRLIIGFNGEKWKAWCKDDASFDRVYELIDRGRSYGMHRITKH
jgi:hypothetical protein